MQMRPLGKTGVLVSVIGYGAQALSLPGRPAAEEAANTLQQVVAHGVNFIDTADTYCLGPGELHHNERLIDRALKAGPRLSSFIATKGGTVRLEAGWEIDGAPDRLYRSIRESYEALGGRRPIDLWQHHWPDPRHTITEVMIMARRAVEEQLVRFVGVSNYSLEQIREARGTIEIVTVQGQLNLWNRQAEVDGILEYCEREDLVFLPWRPLGGLGLAQRLDEISTLREIAQARGVSPQRIMIAWHLAKSRSILPIPGSAKLDNILDSIAAAGLRLDRGEMAKLDGLSAEQLPQRSQPPRWRGSPPLSRREAGQPRHGAEKGNQPT